MSHFGERLSSNRHLGEDDVEWLHALMGDWQLIADLSYSDLVLWGPHTPEGYVSAEGRSYVALSQARPSTTQTIIPRDIVGDRIRADLKAVVERAWTYRVETNSSDQGQPYPQRRG